MEERNYMEQEAVEDKEEHAIEESDKNEKITGFWKDNRGVGVIEIVLILVILIGLVLVFKDQITAIINNAFSAISEDAGNIIN